MGRGKATLVKCSSCGRNVPRGKAVVDYRPLFFSTELKTKGDIKFMEKVKNYYCISCAKSLGIFEKKKKMRRRFRI
jgi:ribosomal protein S26